MNTRSTIERQFLYYTLLLSKGIGPVAVNEIRDAIRFSGLSETEVGKHLLTEGGFGPVILKQKHEAAITDALSRGVTASFTALQEAGQFVLCPDDSVLPSYYWARASAHRLPTIFIAKGDTPPTDVSWIAVIGSRNADAAGLERARSAGAGNAADGLVTISGGARGVDSTATNASHEAGGWVVTVPSSDIDSCKCRARELVISPYPTGTRFSPGLAMARNGVVIGLSDRVIVAAVSPGTNGKPSGTEDAIVRARKMGLQIAT